MLIDAHQHFWRLGENDQTWPTPDLAAIHRDFGPDDLARDAEGLGLTGTVLVQSQPSDRDTDWLLDVATGSDLVLGVVGWADLAAPDAPARIAALAGHPKMRGLRPMLQSLERDDWIADPALAPALAAMARHRLSLDALVLPRHLPHLLTMARGRPDLPIVIDHAAKPPVAEGALAPWRSDMAALAELPQVFCKLSGLPTELAEGQPLGDLAPYIAHVLACFTPRRVMWGSDWPVLKLACDYRTWRLTAEALSGLTEPDDLKALFAETARRFYRL